MKKYIVSVVEYNAEKFAEDYSSYIVAYEEGVMDEQLFTLVSPIEVYNEIEDLVEEGIEIIEDLDD